MSIWDKIRGELVDIVEWTDDSRDTLVYRFQRYQNEIKYGAKLVVREGQAAVFVNEGTIADVFAPGTYTLEAENLPVLSTLRGWKYGFDSPFKAEVYFVATRIFTNAKWGTKNPIMLRDADFGMVRLRAFGNFSYRVGDAATLIKNIVGTGGLFTVDDLGEQLRDMLVARFANALGEAKIAALDVAAHQDEVGKLLVGRLTADFVPFGLQVVTLAVENISLPPEVEAAMDKRTTMGVLGTGGVGSLAAYTQFQTANAIGDAAKQPGGLAGAGMGLAAGYSMANQMGQAMAPQAAPPPLPAVANFFAAIDGKQAGPFDAAALRQQIDGGHVTRQTLIWRQGMASWTAAGQVAEVADQFAAVPPPLPT